FSSAWWMGTFPGLVIMLIVLAVNFVGDAIRDINDVREYGLG
ncbi:MAG: ABC transporter permease, partial [Chloroflexi bacterium]|nr:ABC transporter permease [Chloroflexota bacterium]